MNEDKCESIKKLVDVSAILGTIITVAFLVYGFYSGILTSSVDLDRFIVKVGVWGPIVFILIQIIQVVIPIIPGAFGCVVGVMIFGPLMGFIYNYIGISSGSVIAFLISRRYGVNVVKNIANPKTVDKYIGWLDKGRKFEKLFAIAIFFPVAPDDFLCYLSGLTSISLKKFTAIILLCKPFSIFLYSMGLATITHFALHLMK